MRMVRVRPGSGGVHWVASGHGGGTLVPDSAQAGGSMLRKPCSEGEALDQFQSRPCASSGGGWTLQACGNRRLTLPCWLGRLGSQQKGET